MAIISFFLFGDLVSTKLFFFHLEIWWPPSCPSWSNVEQPCGHHVVPCNPMLNDLVAIRYLSNYLFIYLFILSLENLVPTRLFDIGLRRTT